MSNCLEHKREVAGISDMKALAEMIGDLHYETLATFLFELQTKFHNDSIKDLKAERFNLGYKLSNAAHHTYEASVHIGQAWQISKPFME